jgi:hypothetical protein
VEYRRFVTQITRELNEWLVECDTADALANSLNIDINDYEWFHDLTNEGKDSKTGATSSLSTPAKKVSITVLSYVCSIRYSFS